MPSSAGPISPPGLQAATDRDLERAAANESTPLLLQSPTRTAVAELAAAKPPRLLYLDHIRGLLMVLQSIDHSRGFLSRIAVHHEEWWDMPDFHGSLYHWFVRFLTASCAPGFMMTMGMSIVLFVASRQRMGWGAPAMLRHFFIRGIVLVAFNFLLLPSNMGLVTTVLFALGVNIFLGAVLVLSEGALSSVLAGHLPATTSTVLGIAQHAALAAAIAPLASWYTPGKAHADDDPHGWWFRLAFLPHRQVEGDPARLYSMYAPVPWLPFLLVGVAVQKTIAGFALGPARAGLLHAAVGTAMWIVFIPLRLSEGFGNINPEELHPSPRHSFINFFNLSKYPPSLAYMLCTLGIVHGLCGAFILAETRLRDTAWTSDRNPLIVFGRSAFFFYIAHFYVYRVFRWILRQTGDITGDDLWAGQEGNLPDPAYWLAWVVGLVLLYHMCERYGRFKAGTSPSSIWRFF